MLTAALVATGLDEAQAVALARYARAVRDDERVQREARVTCAERNAAMHECLRLGVTEETIYKMRDLCVTTVRVAQEGR